MALYIFNPSTEIALAADKPSFTPRKTVYEFERNLSLLPALYAPEGSHILIPHNLKGSEEELPYYDWALQRNMVLVNHPRAAESRPCPWGWNKALFNWLLREKIKEHLLPSLQWIDSYRRLANRNTAIRLWELISESCPKSPAIMTMILKERIPREFDNVPDAYRYIATLHGKCVIKWPWSSSGRGIVFTSGLTEPTIRRRLSDAIDSQGTVIVEPVWDRALDFATEWKLTDGKIRFLGFSRFISDRMGRYIGNVVSSQPVHLNRIEAHLIPGQLDTAITLICEAMAVLLSPLSSAEPIYFGIDMLADTAGWLNPCVEINLRMTMGHVALRMHSLLHEEYKLSNEEFIFTPGKPCAK